MAQRGLDIELRKKFQGIELKDFYELSTKVAEFEELLREENQRRKATMGTYYQKVHNHEVAIAYLTTQGSCVFPILVRKTPDLWKKTHTTSAQPQYTFQVSKTEEIFYFLVKEKFITFPENYHLVLSYC